VEIGTGEGKSVVLAVTSIIFAMFGMEVSCASYSEILSSRDWDSFKSIFEAFGV